MAKQQHRTAVTTHYSVRPGEGDAIDVVVDHFVTADGTSVATFGFDPSRAPVPDRKYTADACSMLESRGTIKLLFAQEKIDGSGWRSVLVVQLSREATGRFLAMLDAIQGPSLAEIAEAAKIGCEALVTKPSEPEQAIALSANLAVVALSGHEACLDFYQASPFAIGAVLKSKKLAVDPVVRVDLRSSLLFGLIQGIRDLGIEEPKILVKG